MSGESIRKWLAAIGLEQYAERFEENRVDVDVLSLLSEQDLKDLGVPLGDRRRLLAAISPSGAPVGLPSASADAAASAVPVSQAERRQLTVMFCDLVGSTELSQKLDPETLRELMHSYQQTCGTVIEKYDGHVAQYLGDGLMTYFGWPRAHEDDAERAIRAGLEIVEAVKQVPAPEPLQVRVGIATGTVVVGETGDGDASVPKLAVGETPNVAARIQGLAGADQVMIGPDTRRLVGGTFALDDSGEHALKGIVDPMRAWRVTGESRAEGRFDAAHGEGDLTPLVGRELELGLLMERWQLAQDGEGQVVLLSGEPGIGKSRILSALRERLKSESANAMRFQCSPYYVNSAFWPSIDNFERALKYARDQAPESKLDKLEALMVDHYQRPLADARFIASILSIPCDERYGERAMTPQKFKDETLRTLVDLTEAAARKQPSVLFFEDLHWADPTTLELLDLAIDRVKTIPLLILLTHRPEFQNRWADHGHVISLNLSKLTRAQSAAMVSRVATGKGLPDDLLEQILAKTDGVPLFVEELTKSILESGELKEEADRYEYTGTSHRVTIPATLRDSLMARLDRYRPVKEIAQIGAVIGRIFSYELISAVAPVPTTQLDDALGQLIDSGLAFRRGTPPEATYTFKHALVQDAAYDSLLKSNRQALHGKIAKVINERFPAITENEPEVIAHHLSAAGNAVEAAGLWLLAGQKSLEQGAIPEATSHFYQGLEQLSHWQPGVARDRMELDLKARLGSALSQSVGLAAKETTEAYDEAFSLCQRLDENDPHTLFPVLWGIWLTRHLQGKAVEVMDTADYMLTLAGDDKELQFVAQTARMDSLFFLGNHQGSIASMRIAIELENTTWCDKHLVRYSFDMRNINDLYSALSFYMQGYPDKALGLTDAVIDFGEQSPHPHVRAFSLALGSATYLFMGLFEKHYSVLENAIAYCEEAGLPYWIGAGSCWQSISQAELGKAPDAVARLEQIIPGLRQAGVGAVIPFFRASLASLLGHLKRFDDADKEMQEAINQIEELEERVWEPEVRRLEGDLRLQQGSYQLAEEAFHKSIDIARSQNAKSWELRTSTSLARLWQQQGKKKEAHDLLTPVYNWFTEGFDTKDLKEAKALLEELAA